MLIIFRSYTYTFYLYIQEHVQCYLLPSDTVPMYFVSLSQLNKIKMQLIPFGKNELTA